MSPIAMNTDIRTLRGYFRGEMVTSEDHRWDEARGAFGLSDDDDQPAAIAFPRGDFDRAVLTSFARAAGLKVASSVDEAAGDLESTLLLGEAA
jgi:hypothetical protein